MAKHRFRVQYLHRELVTSLGKLGKLVKFTFLEKKIHNENI